jgi:hypothetical protein
MAADERRLTPMKTQETVIGEHLRSSAADNVFVFCGQAL